MKGSRYLFLFLSISIALLRSPFKHFFSGYCDTLFGVKWSMYEFDYSPLSSANITNEWSYTSTHPSPIYCYGVDGDLLTFDMYRSFTADLLCVYTVKGSTLKGESNENPKTTKICTYSRSSACVGNVLCAVDVGLCRTSWIVYM
jgi:hypothetical protein